MRHLSILFLLLAVASCRSVAPHGTYFDTRPAGAEVLIDGRLSGFVTPCTIDLDRGQDHYVSFDLPGFEVRRVDLEPSDQDTWIPMRDGAAARNGHHFPLFLQVHELFLPRITNNSLAPGRVFMQLHPKRK
jgi:hypothetical protein